MNLSRDTPVSAEDLGATASCVSKSDQMRALARRGYATARIAEALGVRYQFVRNVLTSDARLGVKPAASEARGMTEGGAPAFEGDAGDILRLSVGEGGLIRLPPEAMARLGLRAGSIAVTLMEADRLVLLSGAAAVHRALALLGPVPAPERVASEELIQERRAEAAAEDRAAGGGDE